MRANANDLQSKKESSVSVTFSLPVCPTFNIRQRKHLSPEVLSLFGILPGRVAPVPRPGRTGAGVSKGAGAGLVAFPLRLGHRLSVFFGNGS